jgi:metal transporter CNNM
VIDGALNMHVKLVADIMVPMKKVYAIPSHTVLNEHSFLEIYRNGFSRVPVYEGDGNDKKRIIGILRTRQLMVLNPHEDRLLTTLPLTIPHCVEPNMNLLALVNLLQTGMTLGKGGHMAIVCHNPKKAVIALDKGEAIPPSAGVLGIVTLENCLEALLKEDIIDESDLGEVLAAQRARSAYNHWRTFVAKKKLRRDNKNEDNASLNEKSSYVDVVFQENSPLLRNDAQIP